jgi:hypothetical protein
MGSLGNSLMSVGATPGYGEPWVAEAGAPVTVGVAGEQLGGLPGVRA